jgi:endonuclease YncB( thermonuclease family)
MRVVRIYLALWAALMVCAMPSGAQAKERLAGPFPFEVLEVIDGDTFRVRVRIWLGQTVDVKVRLKGVDTPEMLGQCAAEKELAQAAKKFAAKWLAENPAQLVGVHYGTYAGRVLARVQPMSGDSLSAALLSQKLAKPYRGRRASWCS